jgi:hypothetical protein
MMDDQLKLNENFPLICGSFFVLKSLFLSKFSG